jgi:hypothetical protein
MLLAVDRKSIRDAYLIGATWPAGSDGPCTGDEFRERFLSEAQIDVAC